MIAVALLLAATPSAETLPGPDNMPTPLPRCVVAFACGEHGPTAHMPQNRRGAPRITVSSVVEAERLRIDVKQLCLPVCLCLRADLARCHRGCLRAALALFEADVGTFYRAPYEVS
jgi:hypothetical protein